MIYKKYYFFIYKEYIEYIYFLHNILHINNNLI